MEKAELNNDGKEMKKNRLRENVFNVDKLAAMTEGYAFTDRVFGSNTVLQQIK